MRYTLIGLLALLCSACANFPNLASGGEGRQSGTGRIHAQALERLIGQLETDATEAVDIDEAQLLRDTVAANSSQLLIPENVGSIDWSSSKLGDRYRYESVFRELSGPQPHMIFEERGYELSRIEGSSYFFMRLSQSENKTEYKTEYRYDQGRLAKKWGEGPFQTAFDHCDPFSLGECRRSEDLLLTISFDGGVWTYTSSRAGEILSESIAVYDAKGLILYSKSIAFKGGEPVLYSRESLIAATPAPTQQSTGESP